MVPTRTHQEQPVPVLGHSVICGVQHTIWRQDSVRGREGLNHLVKELPLLPDCQSLDVFEDYVRWAQLEHKPDKVMDQFVPRVVERTLADHGEPLARRSSEHYSDVFISDEGLRANLIGAEVANATANRGATREIELVSGAVNRIKFHCGHDIETRPLKA